MDQTTGDGRGFFSVEEYIIRVEGQVIARVSDRNLLYRVPDDMPSTVFVVEVVYSDVEIRLRLETNATLTVDLPNSEPANGATHALCVCVCVCVCQCSLSLSHSGADTRH